MYLVPLLGRGQHTNPGSGGCLLEVVGSLTGGPWTDRPACVDPVLAALARSVNDLSSDWARPGLAPLIPWLVTPAAGDPVRLAATLTVRAADAALRIADPLTAQRLAADVDDATALLADDTTRLGRLARWRRRRRAIVSVRSAAAAVAQTAPERRDAELRRLLADAIDQARRLDGLPAAEDLVRRGPDECRGPVAIRTRLVVPHGADCLQLRCSAVLDRWPIWLQHSWNRRRAELSAAAPPTATQAASRKQRQHDPAV